MTVGIGIGIGGGGIFAREEHLPAVQASKDLVLKAIYSRSQISAKSLLADRDVDLYSEDAGAGKGYADLLRRPDIQGVIIALPILIQPEYVRAALSAGKHVLSEKPIAENLRDAQELIRWYYENVDTKKVTWSIAENYRYLSSFEYAREQIHRVGKVMNFRVRVSSMVKKGGKYIETPWRKNPRHQGGFLLDGGIHQTAGLRLLLGPENTITDLSAYTTQLQEHLPPVDTIEAILKTKSGAIGTFSLSYGTTFTGREWAIACQGGSISLSGSTITTVFDGKEEKREVADERTGVPPEVRKWGQALVAGERNEKQIPEEALADLELLENMLKSARANGQRMACSLQI